MNENIEIFYYSSVLEFYFASIISGNHLIFLKSDQSTALVFFLADGSKTDFLTKVFIERKKKNCNTL